MPFISLDGCFLKGAYGGQLICDVTRDANNALFPVAFAWVEFENHNSWKWFIEILIEDIGAHRGGLRHFCSECEENGHDKRGCTQRANTDNVEAHIIKLFYAHISFVGTNFCFVQL